jgi:tetratricopeptide (TPR) repeat protein
MPRKPRHRPTADRSARGAGLPARRRDRDSASDTATRRLALPLAACLLAVACGLAYWNSFRAELILDNIPIILQDTRLRTVDWRSVRDILARNYWWPSGDSNLYRPLTTLSYWLNYSVLGGGQSPAGYHAVNLLLHWLNAVLAFLLVRAVTGRAWAALVSAAVLASHPLTVESVTNVVGRADLLAGFSVLGGLLLYRGFLAATGRRRLPWIVALGVTYVAGVFSKESAVVLPALMLLHDMLFPASPGLTRAATLRKSASRNWPAYLAVFPGLALLLSARWAMFHDAPPLVQFGGDNPIVNATFWTGVMTAVKAAGYYLELFIWPARLSCDYSYDAITLFGWTLASGQDPHAWLALAVLLGLAAAAVVAWRRQPPIAFFLGLAAIAFLPTSNLLFPIGTIMAERLMYVPLAGLAPVAVLVITLAERRLAIHRPNGNPGVWTIGGIVIAAAVVGALAVRTATRNEDWTSSLRLWSSAARVVPDSFKVYKALALATFESDPSGERVDEAISLAERGVGIIEQAALPLHQQPVGLYAEAGSYRLRKAQLLAGRGSAGESQGELARAIALLQRAEMTDREVNRLARERLLAAGRRTEQIHDTGNAFVYRTLATAYLGAGEPLRSVAAAEYLQRISPLHFDPHYMRGVAEAAAAQFEEARANPRDAEAHLERAAINLIAATILSPAHRESWSLLAKVYQYLAPTPPAVVFSGGVGRLNRENPVVIGHVQVACVQLLAQLRAAGLAEEAAALRGRMIASLRVPAAVLDAAPATPPQ